MARLTADDVACWVLKTAGPVAAAGELTRCVRPSYRLDLMAAGQPCLLVGGSGVLPPSWLSAVQHAAVLARLPLGRWEP